MDDVADILRVSKKTVSRMLQDGAIPGFKIANQWRFYREDFYRWLDEKRRGGGHGVQKSPASMAANENESAPLSRLIREELVLTGMNPRPIEEMLRALIKPLAASGIIADTEDLLSRLMERERMMSTGVGGGIAVPHLRHPEDIRIERPLVVVGTCPEGAEWNAFDGEPVRLFFLPFSGDEVIHLRTLSAIRRSMAVDGAREIITACESPKEVISAIVKLESQERKRI